MKSIEKPFEYLSEKEKQILQLCQEIILWGTDLENVENPHSLDLKSRATDLYDRLSNTDMNNDDKYYRFYKEYDELKDYFERIKNIEYEDKRIEGDSQELLDEIKNSFKSGKNIRLSKDWWMDQEGYGDYLNISIEHSNNGIRLMINEMHDNYIYEDDLVEEITNILKSFNLEYKYEKHDHSSSADAIEHNFECEVTNFESLEELLLSIVEITEKTKRKFKNK